MEASIYHPLTGEMSTVYAYQIAGAREAGYYTAFERVDVYYASDGKKSECYAYEIAAKKAGTDGTGTWYTAYDIVTIYEHNTAAVGQTYAKDLSGKLTGSSGDGVWNLGWHTTAMYQYWTGNKTYSRYDNVANMRSKGYGMPLEYIPVHSMMKGGTVYVQGVSAKGYIAGDRAQWAAYQAWVAQQRAAAAMKAIVSVGNAVKGFVNGVINWGKDLVRSVVSAFSQGGGADYTPVAASSGGSWFGNLWSGVGRGAGNTWSGIQSIAGDPLGYVGSMYAENWEAFIPVYGPLKMAYKHFAGQASELGYIYGSLFSGDAGQIGEMIGSVGSQKVVDGAVMLGAWGVGKGIGAVKGVGSSKGGGKQSVISNQGNVYDTTPSANHSTTSTSIKGTPNSSVDILDKNGNMVTRRWFAPSGNQFRDVDFTNHGNPKTHPEWPHEHGPRP